MPKGRIIKAISGFYYIEDEIENIFQTRARGVFRLQKITPLVGDYVEFESDNEAEGTVTKIMPRQNELHRPPIANVDVGVVVTSIVEPKFSPLLLDRFLVHLEENYIQPVIYISKSDLATSEERRSIKKYTNYYESIGYHVIQVESPTDEKSLQAVFSKDFAGHTIMFMGQSGAGKSTLLNALDPTLNLETAQTSPALGRGRHTTRSVELLPLLGGNLQTHQDLVR